MFNAATQRLNPFVMVFQVQVDCALESALSSYFVLTNTHLTVVSGLRVFRKGKIFDSADFVDHYGTSA